MMNVCKKAYEDIHRIREAQDEDILGNQCLDLIKSIKVNLEMLSA